MQIHRYPLGQMQANCYVLIKGSDCIIIDPADDADFILGQITRHKVNLLAVLATHGHFDHVMAGGELQIQFPEIPFFIHAKDSFLLKRVVETARHFLGYDPVTLPIQSPQDLKEGKMTLGSFHFEVIHTPGHTPGSCAFYFEKEKALFVGDLIFQEGVGRTDFSYSDSSLMSTSLDHITKLPADVCVYSGHGEPFLLEEKK